MSYFSYRDHKALTHDQSTRPSNTVITSSSLRHCPFPLTSPTNTAPASAPPPDTAPPSHPHYSTHHLSPHPSSGSSSSAPPCALPARLATRLQRCPGLERSSPQSARRRLRRRTWRLCHCSWISCARAKGNGGCDGSGGSGGDDVGGMKYSRSRRKKGSGRCLEAAAG